MKSQKELMQIICEKTHSRSSSRIPRNRSCKNSWRNLEKVSWGSPKSNIRKESKEIFKRNPERNSRRSAATTSEIYPEGNSCGDLGVNPGRNSTKFSRGKTQKGKMPRKISGIFFWEMFYMIPVKNYRRNRKSNPRGTFKEAPGETPDEIYGKEI